MNFVPDDQKYNTNKPLYNYFKPKKSQKKKKIMKKRCSSHPTFQAAMKGPIMVGQSFGLFPVLGVSEKEASKLRFRFCSGRCLYTFISILGQGFIVCVNIAKMFLVKKDSWADKSTIMFFGSNCIISIMFLRLAMKWPGLSQHIAKVESSNSTKDTTLVKKCNVTCAVIFSFAFLEHILSCLVGISIAINCHPDVNLYQAFAEYSFGWLWNSFSYNPIISIVTQIFVVQCTLNWNFADVFVICISFYLTSRLQQVNDRIIAMKGKYVPACYWRMMREDYTNTTHLVKKVDGIISSITFISFFNNLHSICMQILHLLENGIKMNSPCSDSFENGPLNGHEQAVYLIYSFIFLLGRAMAVSLVASGIHSASYVPAYALYDVPSASYSVEVQRFLEQVKGDSVALTGFNFFNVQRGLVLAIAATIVTYELVLLQFAEINPTQTTASQVKRDT